MENPTIEKAEQKVLKVSKKKLLIAIIIIVIASIAWNNLYQRHYYTQNDVEYVGYGMEATSVAEMPMNERNIGKSDGMMYEDIMVSPEPIPPYWNRNVDITDTREFLKTNYSSHIYTKDVLDTVDKVEYAVRSVDGRIDNINSSERYGNVSFVIAKSNLSEFRDEVEKFTHAKLFTENISSENLLFEKQDIEERTEDTIESLDEAEQAKKDLDSAHQTRISNLTTQIILLQNKLDDAREEKTGSAAGNEDRLQVIATEEAELIEKIIALQQEHASENQNYSYRNSSLVKKISSLGGNLEDLGEEDTDFLNNVETVEGYITVSWISYWDKYERLSPTPMWFNTVVLIAIIWWFLRWRRIIPKIQLV